jgi:hypothetical protein
MATAARIVHLVGVDPRKIFVTPKADIVLCRDELGAAWHGCVLSWREQRSAFDEEK